MKLVRLDLQRTSYVLAGFLLVDLFHIQTLGPRKAFCKSLFSRQCWRQSLLCWRLRRQAMKTARGLA